MGKCLPFWTGLLSGCVSVCESVWAGARARLREIELDPAPCWCDLDRNPVPFRPGTPIPALLQCLVIAHSVPSSARAGPAHLPYHSHHPEHCPPVPPIVCPALTAQPCLPQDLCTSVSNAWSCLRYLCTTGFFWSDVSFSRRPSLTALSLPLVILSHYFV